MGFSRCLRALAVPLRRSPSLLTVAAIPDGSAVGARALGGRGDFWAVAREVGHLAVAAAAFTERTPVTTEAAHSDGSCQPVLLHPRLEANTALEVPEMLVRQRNLAS